jgi:hypothetical protein
MLPLVPATSEILYQALLRGTLRSATTEVKGFIKQYLTKDLVMMNHKVANINNESRNDSKVAQQQGKKTTSGDDGSYDESIAQINSSRLMISDLLRQSHILPTSLLPSSKHANTDSDDDGSGDADDGMRDIEVSDKAIARISVDNAKSCFVTPSVVSTSMSEAIMLFKSRRQRKNDLPSVAGASKSRSIL